MNKQLLSTLLSGALLFSVSLAQECVVSLEFLAEKGFSKDSSIHDATWRPASSTVAYVGANGGNKDVRIGEFATASVNFNKIAHADLDGSIGEVNTAAWLRDSKSYLAVGGYTAGKGEEIQVFRYKNEELIKKTSANMPEVNGLDWLSISGSGARYLAVGGFDDFNGQELRIYQYVDGNLHFITSDEYFHGFVSAVEWFTNGPTLYLATSGFEKGVSIARIIRVYSFDPTTGLLTLIATDTFDLEPAFDIKEITSDDVMYIAAVGYSAIGEQIQIFSFDGASLTEITDAAFSHSTVYSADWLSFNDTLYLAVGGDAGEDNTPVRIYSFDGVSLNLATELDLAYVPSSVEWQVLDGVAYLLIGGKYLTPQPADADPLFIYQLVLTNCDT